MAQTWERTIVRCMWTGTATGGDVDRLPDLEGVCVLDCHKGDRRLTRTRRTGPWRVWQTAGNIADTFTVAWGFALR